MELMHAAETQDLDVAGHTVGEIRVALKHVLNIGNQDGNQEARLDGERVDDDVVVSHDNCTLEFIDIEGHKGVGRVWDADEYRRMFGLTEQDFRNQIQQGLKVMQLADGTVRVTETAVDDFLRGGVGGDVIGTIAASLKRIADHFDPPPPDIIGTDYIADRLGCTVVWVAKMASEGKIPKNCIVPGTGIGKPWKFYRSRIDPWILMR